jgi:hypothetical protein
MIRSLHHRIIFRIIILEDSRLYLLFTSHLSPSRSLCRHRLVARAKLALTTTLSLVWSKILALLSRAFDPRELRALLQKCESLAFDL